MTQDEFKARILEYHEAKHELAIDFYHFWRSEIAFTLSWWIGLSFIVVPWVIWFFVRNKRNTHRYLYAGFFIMTVSSYLDFVGIQAGLWAYKIQVIPTIPAFFIWDFTLLPVFAMLLLQYKPKLNPYIKALIYSIIGSLIAEPFFTWIGYYQPIRWEYAYSVPIQFIIYFIAYKLCFKIPLR